MAAFFATFVIIGLAFWWPVWNLLKLAIENDEYTHTLIILPLSIVLIALDRRRIFCGQCRNLPASISWCFAGGFLAVMGISVPVYSLTFFIGSLVSFWIALFVFFFGTHSFNSALFPLLIGFLMVPIPRPILNVLVSFLQEGSAWLAFHLLRLTGLPVGRDGLVLFLPGLNIEVAAECSGIRSSLVLFVTTIVIANLFLKRVWKQVLVALLVVPVTILKNGFRIFFLSFWAVTVDVSILSSWIHRNGGVVFFLIGLSLILLSIWLLQKFDKPKERQTLKVSALFP